VPDSYVFSFNQDFFPFLFVVQDQFVPGTTTSNVATNDALKKFCTPGTPDHAAHPHDPLKRFYPPPLQDVGVFDLIPQKMSLFPAVQMSTKCSLDNDGRTLLHGTNFHGKHADGGVSDIEARGRRNNDLTQSFPSVRPIFPDFQDFDAFHCFPSFDKISQFTHVVGLCSQLNGQGVQIHIEIFTGF
jgi:hypothetical protein